MAVLPCGPLGVQRDEDVCAPAPPTHGGSEDPDQGAGTCPVLGDRLRMDGHRRASCPTETWASEGPPHLCPWPLTRHFLGSSLTQNCCWFRASVLGLLPRPSGLSFLPPTFLPPHLIPPGTVPLAATFIAHQLSSLATNSRAHVVLPAGSWFSFLKGQGELSLHKTQIA